MLCVEVTLKNMISIYHPSKMLLTLYFLFRVGAMVDVRCGCHPKEHVNNFRSLKMFPKIDIMFNKINLAPGSFIS